MALAALVRAWRADEAATGEPGWTWNLALFRVVFVGGSALPVALSSLAWTSTTMPGLPRDAWQPVSFYRALPIELVIDAALAQGLALANVAALLAALVGLRTRIALAAAAVLSLYVLGLPNCQGAIKHHHSVVWFLALLAAGPAGYWLAVDARRRGLAPPPRHAALWTLRFVWMLMGLVYLVPGLAKLERTIWAGWSDGDNLRAILHYRWLELALYEPAYAGPTWLDLRLAALPTAALALASLAVIAFELGLWAFLPFRRTRGPAAIAAVAFHAVNGIVLDIAFPFLLACFVGCVDWAALTRRRDLRWAPGDRPPRPAAVVVVGTGLVVLQAATSLALLSADLVRLHPASGLSARQVAAAIEARRPVWPFDRFPTFAYRYPTEVAVWEPRAILPGGEERRLTRSAFAAALGPPTRCLAIVQEAERERDAARHRARSVALLAALWPRERPEVRTAAQGVAIYRAVYSSDPARRLPIRAERLYVIPAVALPAR